MKGLRCRASQWYLGCICVFWRDYFNLLFKIVEKIFIPKNQFPLVYSYFNILLEMQPCSERIWHCFYQRGEFNYLLKNNFFRGICTDMKEHPHFILGKERCKTGLQLSMWACVYVYQAPPDVKGGQCLKSSGTGVINVPCCLWKSPAWEYLTPCTIWKPFLAHGDWYFRNSGLLPAYFVSFAWLDSLTTPTLLSFIPYHFLRLNVLAASSALCLSFSSYLQKPIFPHEQDNLGTVYIYIQLPLLLYRGANSFVIFRHSSVNRQWWEWQSIPRDKTSEIFIFTPTQVHD